MAWIRRVRTASGATAVQIAESVRGRRRIVAHVGSAHSEVDLGLLLHRAQQMLAGMDQEGFDLGIEPGVRSAGLLAPTGEQALFDDETAPGPRSRRVLGAGPKVVATPAVLLFDVLAGVFDDLGFSTVGDAVFRDLVLARIVSPTSILDVPRVLRDLGRTPASDKTFRRTLQRCVSGIYRDQIAARCFEHAATSGDVSLCLYDVTTLYFEAAKEDDLRKVGFSKERRVDPQIVVGMLVDRHGFPLEFGFFEGNKAETATILPIIRQFAARHRIETMVVAADAGMLSAQNLREIDEAGFGFIVGSRATKAPVDLESHFRWYGTSFTDGQVIDTVTPKIGRKGASDPLQRAEPVWNPEEHDETWRAVWAYSTRRAAHDRKTLTAQEERARQVVAGEKAARSTRFVKVKGTDRAVDEQSVARAKRLVGLKGYVTNLPITTMAAEQVISSYHDLWTIEQTFRMSKSDLAARPMFVRTKDAIEAHLTITFTALAVAREVQNRTGFAIRKVVRDLQSLRSAVIAANGSTRTYPPNIDSRRQAIVDAVTRNARH